MKKIEVAIDARMANRGADQVVDAFDEMVNSAQGAARDMGRSGDRIDDSFDSTGRSSKRASSLISEFKTAFVLTAAIAGVATLALGIQALVTDIDEIGKAAGKANVSTDFFQELKFAAGQSGVEVATVEGLLKDLTIRLGQAAQGSAPMIKAFEDIGVEIRNMDGSLKSVEQIFPEVANGLTTLGSDAERAATGIQIFGESYTQANNLLKDGAETFETLGAKAREMGIILSEETFTAAANLNDEMDVLSQVIKAQFAGALTAVTPLILATVTGMASLAKVIGDTFKALGDFVGINQNFTATTVGIQSDAQETENRFIGLTLSIARAKKALQDLGDNPNPKAVASINSVIAALVNQQSVITFNRDENKKAIQEEKDEIIARSDLSIRLAELASNREFALGERNFKQFMDNLQEKKEAELIAQIGIGTKGEVAEVEDVIDDSVVNNTIREDFLRRETDYIAESLLSREELKLQSLARETEYIEEAMTLNVLTHEKGQALITAIEEKAADARSLIIASSVAQAVGGVSKLILAVGGGNEALTSLARDLAITQIGISTYAAVMKGYEQLGPIAGSFAAVGLVATGAAQVAGVISASGSSSPANTSAAINTSGESFTSTVATGANGNRPEQGGVVVNFHITGVAPDEYIEQTLMPKMADIINNNDVILFDANSRQATALGGAG